MSGVSHKKRITVSIIMEVGSSLSTWEAMGILQREIGYYRALSELGLGINLLCYGERENNDYPALTGDIRVLYNRMRLPRKMYRRRIHQVHAPALLQAQLLATHNTHAMLATMRAQWAWRLPFIMRMGYLWSQSALDWPENSEAYIQDAIENEREAFTRATHIITNHEGLAKGALKLAPAAGGKISIIPKFVDCDLFRPVDCEKRYDLVYVGRLAGIKNLEATLEAVERAGATIAIIGGGTPDTNGQSIDSDYAKKLKARFGDMNGRADWLGLIPNEDLPAAICQAKALILCSLSEGSPRALFEALACGLPAIGSEVGGIAVTLRHGQTGYFCGTDANSIAAAIETVLSQPRLIEEMGVNAREFALKTYSLPTIARKEYELLLELAGRHRAESAAKRVANYVMRRR